MEEKTAEGNPRFIEAINSSKIQEIPTLYDEIAVGHLMEQLRQTGIFLLGEAHGVLENPSIIYTLMKKFNLRGLSLEWDKEAAESLQAYITTTVIPTSGFLAWNNDGRVTAGHFQLLKKLKEEGMLEKLILFNPLSSSSAEERDKGMADNILASYDSTVPTLVVAGRVHTRTEAVVGADGNIAIEQPMGKHVRKQIPNVPIGEIKYLNEGPDTFEQVETLQNPASFRQDENGKFVYVLPVAHPAIIPGTLQTAF